MLTNKLLCLDFRKEEIYTERRMSRLEIKLKDIPLKKKKNTFQTLKNHSFRSLRCRSKGVQGETHETQLLQEQTFLCLHKLREKNIFGHFSDKEKKTIPGS